MPDADPPARIDLVAVCAFLDALAITPADVGRAIGYNPRYMAQLLHGRRRLKPDTRTRLLAYLEKTQAEHADQMDRWRRLGMLRAS